VKPGDDSWDRQRPQPVFSQDARSTNFSDILDGTSNTLMYLETDASESVAWESPRNWVFDPQNPRRGLGMTYGKGFNAAFVDGSIRFLDNSVSDETLRNLVLRNDGNVVFLP
jgi:prepilin-type processing-associated H-X9-DG protein